MGRVLAEDARALVAAYMRDNGLHNAGLYAGTWRDCAPGSAWWSASVTVCGWRGTAEQWAGIAALAADRGFLVGHVAGRG